MGGGGGGGGGGGATAAGSRTYTIFGAGGCIMRATQNVPR